ncbi:MAG: translational GTPase TypA [Candidatus Levybacteria bacterium]|nr:translational GTPase TypA [Candidatus Levybacteria bacterium]
MKIKNVAIIAHVDHGKTTLVDAMLKQTHTFRDNQKEMTETLIMDSNDLEKEKGITILSKNTSVFYNDVKINIIDTPGHADFGGEVERVMNMASGAILLVDAVEGCLPQTRFVLKKALDAKLKIILIVNKIDKRDSRPQEVITEVENLFLEVAQDPSHLNFITLFAVGRDGKAFFELPEKYSENLEGDLTPLFETILNEVPESSVNENLPFQMLISTLDYDSHVGKLCIGKVTQGLLNKGQNIALVDENSVLGNYRVQKLYTSVGLERKEVDSVTSGDIIAIAGISELTIGQTITDPANPVSLPKIQVEDPTIKVTIGPNTSPFLGRDGKYCSSNQIKDRLLKEKEINLGLRIEDDPNSSNFVVAGRGELHLAVLIETMRREGFELQVSKPQVIYKTINGVLSEPFEEITIDVVADYVGVITEEMAKRKAEMIDMRTEPNNTTRFVYKASSQNLLGIRNSLLTKTRGTATLNSFFLGYSPKQLKMEIARNGSLIAAESGTTLSYGLANAQDRGSMFVGPAIPVYEGMVVGVSTREKDIEINVCKAKQLTNNRSAGEGVGIQLTPPTALSLEQALDFINDDEVLEVTPLNLRIRKRYLSTLQRRLVDRKTRDSQASLRAQ